MQTRPAITISAGVPANLGPLILVLFISLIKDAYEDYQRHKRDENMNLAQADVYDKRTN